MAAVDPAVPAAPRDVPDGASLQQAGPLPTQPPQPPQPAPDAATAPRSARSTGTSDASARSPSALRTLQALWHELPGLINDRIELLSLELRRAGVAMAQMVVLAIGAAILAAVGWLLLWAVIVLLLVNAGVAPTLALLVALLVHAAAAWWAVARVRRLLPSLQLAATRRHLHIGAPSSTSAAQSDHAKPRTHAGA